MATELISNEEAKRKLESGEDVLILDARSEEVYTGGSDQVEGAIHLPEVIAREVYTQLPKNKEYLVYSTRGEEEISKQLVDFLKDKGFTAYAINGGYEEWRDSGMPIEPIKARGTPLL